MAAVEVKSSGSADETRPFTDKGRSEIMSLAGSTVGLTTCEPGWKWSEHVKPIAGTESCQTNHIGYVVSGSMKIAMDDGSEAVINGGDVFNIPAGHDAWVEGDEACTLVDFGDLTSYAKSS